MTKKQISTFQEIEGQLQSFHTELTTLTKKSPNDALNAFKLTLVNAVLKRANSFLGKDRQPFPEFALFNEDALPSNSDVLIIVSQYISSFEKVRADNSVQEMGRWYWKCTDEEGGKPTIRMTTPRNAD
jgi:hypothetical protein